MRNEKPISSREREVIEWLSHGKNTWEISSILGISESTVKFHINNIMRKLDAVNRPHIVALAFSRGLIPNFMKRGLAPACHECITQIPIELI